MILRINLFLFTIVHSQWAYLGGSKDNNDPGKSSGPNLWPSARGAVGFTFKDNQLFVFGGYTEDGYQNDLWTLDVIAMSWKRIGPQDNSFIKGSLIDRGKFSPLNWPEQLFCRSMFQVNDMLYLFPSYNGFDDSYPIYYIYNITSSEWYFDVVENELHIHFSNPWFTFSSYFDFEANNFYLFGVGERIIIANMTSLEFRLGSETKFSSLLGYSASAIDEERKTIYLFGGFRNDSTALNNIFSYEIETGTQEQLDLFNFTEVIAPTLNSHGLSGVYSDSYFPSVRTVASFCLDKKHNRFILFGGYEPNSCLGYSDLWLFNVDVRNWAYIAGPTKPGSISKFGKKGVPSATNYPSQRYRNVFFYEEEEDIFFIFGGEYLNGAVVLTLNDFWAYYFQYNKLRKSTSTNNLNIPSESERNYKLSTTISFKPENASVNMNITYMEIGIFSFFCILLFSYAIFRSRFKSKLMKKTDVGSTEVGWRNETISAISMVETSAIGENERTAFFPDSMETLSLPAFKECSSKDFKIIKYLTRGSMGKICLAQGFKKEFLKQGNSEDHVIVKLMADVDVNPSPEKEVAFIQEVAIMEMLSYFPNVAKLLGFCRQPMCIIMKYYINGSLSSLLRSSVKLSTRRKVELILDLSKGIKTIHDHDIVHCDIKSDNILLDYDENLKRLVCLITDFGICQVTSSKSLKVKTFQVSEIKGFSYNYAAPEVFQQKGTVLVIHKSRDIYSLGVLIGEVFTRLKPWSVNKT